MLRSRAAFAAVVAVAIVLLASCSSSSNDAGSGAAPQGMPDVTVTDIATGDAVTLVSVTKPDRPTLVWFWAPF